MLDDLKWKGSKKRLRDNRRKLENKLRKIYKRVNDNSKTGIRCHWEKC